MLLPPGSVRIGAGIVQPASVSAVIVLSVVSKMLKSPSSTRFGEAENGSVARSARKLASDRISATRAGSSASDSP